MMKKIKKYQLDNILVDVPLPLFPQLTLKTECKSPKLTQLHLEKYIHFNYIALRHIWLYVVWWLNLNLMTKVNSKWLTHTSTLFRWNQNSNKGFPWLICPKNHQMEEYNTKSMLLHVNKLPKVTPPEMLPLTPTQLSLNFCNGVRLLSHS